MSARFHVSDVCCFNCRYHDHNEVACRRAAPVAFKMDDECIEACWPTVNPGDWCGEFNRGSCGEWVIRNGKPLGHGGEM